MIFKDFHGVALTGASGTPVRGLCFKTWGRPLLATVSNRCT